MENFMKFDSFLSEEERIFKDMVRRWARHAVYPRVQRIWTDKTYNREEHEFLRRELADLGMFDLYQHSYVLYGLACQELEYIDSGLRSFVSVQNSLVSGLIEAGGSWSQKKHYLQGLSQGRLTGCFALTEPDRGSNPAELATSASVGPMVSGTTEPDDEQRPPVAYYINGSKMFITNGVFADFMIVWAISPYDNQPQAFIVDATQPGIERREIPNKESLRYSDTAEIYFTEAVGFELPNAVGIKFALSCLNKARYGIAWGAIGAALACFELALEYTKTRIQFHGKPIASHQLVQKSLVDMFTEIVLMQEATLKLGRLMDDGRAHYSQVSMLKRNNVKKALEIAREARDLLGAYGICTEYDIVRHMLNLESVVTYEGTHNVHTLIVGREITGEDAF